MTKCKKYITNPINPTIKTEIIPVAFIVIMAVASFYLYQIFPERVPIHWNFAGEVDGWGVAFYRRVSNARHGALHTGTIVTFKMAGANFYYCYSNVEFRHDGLIPMQPTATKKNKA